MKKNIKFIGVAAAALLAVAPVATSVVPQAGSQVVKAAKTKAIDVGGSNQSSSNSTVNFFSYKNGSAIKNNQDSIQINASSFTTLGSIQKNIEDNFTFSEGSGGHPQKVKISTEAIANQLKDQNIAVSGTSASTKVQLPSNFYIRLTATVNGQSTSIRALYYTGSTPTAQTDGPVFYVNNSKATPNTSYKIAEGTTFNPLDFKDINGNEYKFTAQQSANNNGSVNVSVSSNPVNTSQEGKFYTVTLTATNTSGKTSTYSYTVLIVSSGKQPVYTNGNESVPTYAFYGNDLTLLSSTLKDGQEVYVGNDTRTFNNISYTKISLTSKADANSNSSNLWIPTSALTNNNPKPVEKTETHTVMVASRAYDKNGNYLGHDYDTYTSIDIVPTVVTINGKTYYKVAGKDEYVRVTNITGTRRRLTRNAYIYWSSYRRTPGTGKMYRGDYVTTYGAAYRFRVVRSSTEFKVAETTTRDTSSK